jgi:hypothetical protein
MRALITSLRVRLNRIPGPSALFPEFTDLYLHSIVNSLEESLLIVEAPSPAKLLVHSCRVQLTGQALVSGVTADERVGSLIS